MLGSVVSVMNRVLLVLSVVVVVPAAASVSVTNGGFESPNHTSLEFVCTPAGWGSNETTVYPAAGTSTDGYLDAVEGARYGKVDASLLQTVNGLVVGEEYVLCFKVYGQETTTTSSDTDSDDTHVKVTVTGGTVSHFGGTPAGNLTVTAPARNNDGTDWSGGYWHQYELCIVATATTMTFDFSEVTAAVTGKTRYTSFIDEVALKCKEDYDPPDTSYPPRPWPENPKTYQGPLDLIVGAMDGDHDAQIDGNEDQEDERDGIKVLLGNETPVFAMVTEELTGGTAHLTFKVPEGVRVIDSTGTEVTDLAEVTWTTNDSHADGNSRRFTVYSQEPCEGWFKLEVKNPVFPGGSLTRTQDAANFWCDCACDPTSGIGSILARVWSADVQIDLGTIRYGDSAGYLHLKASEPSADLYTPGALQVFAHNDLIVTDLDTNGGTITAQPYASDLWGAAKVTVVSATEYRIAFYDDENTMAADTTNSGATAFRVLTVKKPAGVVGNDEIYVSETQRHSGVTTRYWHYKYSTPGGVNTWVMIEGSGVDTAIRVTRRTETTVGSGVGAVRTETMGVYEPAHSNFTTGLVYEVEEVYEAFDWGEELISRTVDPDGLAYKETWTYEDDTTAGDDYSHLIAYESATGYWERYRYKQAAPGGDYRDLTVSQLHSNALDMGETIEDEADLNIATYLTRNNYSADVGAPSDEPVYVESTQVKVVGVLESSAYKIVREEVSGQDDLDERWMVACTVSDPVAATSATNELDLIGKILQGENADLFVINRTWKWKYDSTLIDDDSDPDELYKTVSPDGALTVFDRSYSFRRRTVVTTSGYDTDQTPDGLINYGTRSTVVLDPRGNVASSLSERAVTNDDWFIESFVERLQEDTFGRPTQTGFYFGADAKTASTGGVATLAFQTFDTHACCGTGSSTSHTGRDGVRTLVEMDALGRQIAVTTGDGSTSMELKTEFGLDAAGNVLTVTRKPLAGSAEPDLVTTSTYNVAGQVTSIADAEGRKNYLTYGRVQANGSVYTPGTHSGHFWWETRAYGHDNTVPVGVSWTDSQGDRVLGFTATTSWTGAAAPTATETLTTEHTRSVSEYKWVSLPGSDIEYRVTSRVYHDLSGLAKGLTAGAGTQGTEGTNYLATGEVIMDPMGRVLRTTDAAGNISEPVYEDETSLPVGSRMGIDSAALKDVAGLYFNEFTTGTAQNPTGERRPYITRAYGIRPGLNEAPAEDATMTDFDYIESDVDFNVVAGALVDRTVWTKPAPGTGPWSSITLNAQGQRIESRTYENGDTNTVLTAIDYTYITGHTTDNNGRLQYADRREVSSGTVQATRLRSELYYNDAGYQIKTFTPGRGLTKIELDDYGRMARSVFASAEGANTAIEGADAFTDDIVLTEVVYGYNKADQTIQTTTYDRAHDAPGTVTGLLSAASASRSRVNHSASWFDNNRRLTHSTNYGTNGNAVFTRPASAPATNTSDDRITTQVEYDAAGYAYLITDNKGIQTRRYYNNLGQVTHSVENYVAAEFTDADDPTTITSRDADECRITAYGYDFTSTNASGLRTTMTAVDPNHDGNTADNQTTHFINTGELDTDMRGWVPSNSRVVAVLHADAFEDGTTRANVITEINSGTFGTPGTVHGDFVYSEFYAGGEAHATTDQRGVVWTNTYTTEGYLDYRVATAATGSGWAAPSGSDVRCQYTYGDAGELLTATAYSDTAGGVANRTSSTTHTYDGFYNRLTEAQDHDPTANSGAGIPRNIAFGYDTTSSGGAADIYTNAYRRNQVTYPNGRVIKLVYTPGSIDDAISRASGIDDVIGGTDTAITRYTYMGSGRLASKDYPGPDLRLDFIDEGTEGDIGDDGYDESWDRFGRTARCQWERYDSNGDGAGVTGSDGENVFLTRHGYDRVSNNLYDQDEVYGAYSTTRRFDDLHRMIGQDHGIIELDGSGDVDLTSGGGHASVDDFWKVRGRDWELDQTNNATATDSESVPDQDAVAVNAGNEIETYTSNALNGADEVATYFTTNGNKDIFTEAINCTLTNDVTVDYGNDNRLVINAGSTTAPAIILTGEDRTLLPFATSVQSPDATGIVGLVFGYKSPLDYWVWGIDFDSTSTEHGDWVVYHIQDADGSGSIDYTDADEKKLVLSSNATYTGLNTWYGIYSRALANTLDFTNANLALSGGLPSGKFGLYTEVSGAKYNYFRAVSDMRTACVGAAWETTNTNEAHYLSSGNGNLWTAGTWHRQYHPILLRGLHAQRFQATFSMQRRSTDPYASGNFVFNVRGPGDFDRILLTHNATGSAPEASSVRGGSTIVSLTEDRDAANVPGRTASETLWYRVVSDGVDVKVFAATTEAGLDTVQSNDDWCMRTTATTDRFAFSDGVGRLGFMGGAYNQYWDNVTIKTDDDNDADLTDPDTYEIPEIVDTFDLTSNKIENPFVYDAAGNLTFNGFQRLTYDAHNRLIKVENAYWDDTQAAGQEVQVGSVVATHQYDPSGRLIVDERYDAEGLSEVIRRYYVGHSEVETRNGSDQVLSQQVWDSLAPGMYIDSLAQVAHNLQPGVDDAPGSSGTQDLVDARLYVMQDASFNVIGLASPLVGDLVERYEYDAYGRRFVYQSAGGEYAKLAWLDASNDGLIGVEELDLLLANWEDTVTPYDRSRGEFTGDGVVDDDDLDLIIEYFGWSSTSANDPLVLHATGGESQRLDHAASPGQTLNDFGFQGLRHDTHTGFVYNRARWYDVDRGRFNNADPHPAIFPDGMNRYAAYHVLGGGMDPSGMDMRVVSGEIHVDWTPPQWFTDELDRIDDDYDRYVRTHETEFMEENWRTIPVYQRGWRSSERTIEECSDSVTSYIDMLYHGKLVRLAEYLSLLADEKERLRRHLMNSFGNIQPSYIAPIADPNFSIWSSAGDMALAAQPGFKIPDAISVLIDLNQVTNGEHREEIAGGVFSLIGAGGLFARSYAIRVLMREFGIPKLTLTQRMWFGKSTFCRVGSYTVIAYLFAELLESSNDIAILYDAARDMENRQDNWLAEVEMRENMIRTLELEISGVMGEIRRLNARREIFQR